MIVVVVVVECYNTPRMLRGPSTACDDRGPRPQYSAKGEPRSPYWVGRVDRATDQLLHRKYKLPLHTLTMRRSLMPARPSMPAPLSTDSCRSTHHWRVLMLAKFRPNFRSLTKLGLSIDLHLQTLHKLRSGTMLDQCGAPNVRLGSSPPTLRTSAQPSTLEALKRSGRSLYKSPARK